MAGGGQPWRSARDPVDGGAPVNLWPWEGAEKVQLGTAKLPAGSISPEGRRPQRIGDGGTSTGGGARAARRAVEEGSALGHAGDSAAWL
jgi:hypothetical protein